jgi:hypothetical protein
MSIVMGIFFQFDVLLMLERDLNSFCISHVECGVQALVAVLQACSSSAQLALFEESVVNIIILLLERSQTELRIAALKAVAFAVSKKRTELRDHTDLLCFLSTV